MNIQIIGTKKCSETRKAERFFKERRISAQFRDLNEKGVSKGELDNITRSIPLEELIDREGKEYKKLNLQYITHNVEDALLEHPLLFKTPIVRNGKQATLGYRPEIWKNWE
jgi:arsenate reductase-like glutaredoxin family protein